MIRYLLLIVLLSLFALTALAQESADETVMVYYENENPEHLDVELVWKNVCLESFIQLNPDLDFNNMPYGQPYEIPANESCYQRDEYGWEVVNKTPRLKYYENGEWLDKPYYSSDVAYTYPYDYSIEQIADLYGVCVDDLLAENVLLQSFEEYFDFTDITTPDIFIPQGEPSCVSPPNADEKLIIIYPKNINFSPRYFSEEFNICPEELPVASYFYYTDTELPEYIGFKVKETQPCYNDEGQRLSYYDEFGNKLSVPTYSDFPIYIAPVGETLDTIAQKYDVCLIDILRLNGFPNMPMTGEVEIFIPPSRQCPQELKTIQTKLTRIRDISWEINICKNILRELNPQLQDTYPYNYPKFYFRFQSINKINHWIIAPAEQTPCYEKYEAQEGESLYEIEQLLNICYEVFESKEYIRNNVIQENNTIIYFPLDSLPCYNNEGQRLYYPPQEFTRFEEPNPPPPPYYTGMQRYTLQRGDNAFSISQQFNVCVYDLLQTNKPLKSSMILGLRIFIPDTRPCYDDGTGLPLIYEDKDGQLLPEPQVSKSLIYYGGEPRGRISNYYNVCENRIYDANRAKFDREASYLGLIIPTDRPPCYDADGNFINYVCYTQPVNMSTDYRDSDKTITLNNDGTNCYDLEDPDTVIWYENKPYKLINYHQNVLFTSRAFTAWCYGVSLEEIDFINAQEDVLAMLPLYARLIPQPTRDCYVENPEMLEQYSTIHTVREDETLSSIAKLYDVPYVLISRANEIDGNNTIWTGQKLIIPDGFTWRSLILSVSSLIGFVSLFGLLYLRKRRYYGKKKGMPKKREAVA